MHATPFEGTWQVELELTELPQDSVAVQIVNGRLESQLQDPNISAPLSGAVTPIRGDEGLDSLAVVRFDRRRVEVTGTLADREVWKVRYLASKDRLTLQVDVCDHRGPVPVHATTVFERVGKPREAANAFVGLWRAKRLLELTPTIMNYQIADIDNGLWLRSGEGAVCEAKFDLHSYPCTGYPDFTSVTLSRLGQTSFQINRTQRAAIASMLRVRVSDDGSHLTLTSVDWSSHRRTIWHLRKVS